MKNLIKKLSAVIQLDEAVRPGQYFVLVDVSKPGGKMIGGLYHGAKSADKEAAKYHKKGRNVQVVDAKWYGPAAELLRQSGMSEDRKYSNMGILEEGGKTYQIAVRDDGGSWSYTIKGPGVSKQGTGKNLHQALAYAASAIVRG